MQYKIANDALIEAVSERNTDRIDLCLKKGADINTRNAGGRTPLMMAVWFESPGLLEFILSKNPDLFLTDNSGRTAFDLLKEANNNTSRQKMTDILLAAMPDAPGHEDTAPAAGNDADDKTEGFNEVATRKDVRVARPITLSPRKPGGGEGGFKL